MKAWVLDDIGQFNLREVDKAKLTFGDVLVNVKAAGICGSDIPRVYKNGAHKMPIIIGHEMAGEVVCAPGPKSHLMGKRVGIFPLIPCMKCPQCKKRQYELCRNYDYLGSRSDGGFAEYVKLPGMNIIELPENVSYEAAAMLEPMAVAVHAIKRVTINEGDKIVISGLGTIGLLLLMFILEKYPAENVYLVGNKAFQKEKALEAGIIESHYFDINNGNAIDWINDTARAVNVFFECVGKNENLSLAVNAVSPMGSICLVGNPYSDMLLDRDSYWKILRNQISLTGTWNSSFLRNDEDDWHYAVNLLAAEKINPEKLITHRFTMDNLDEGFKLMRDKKEDYIKVMMTNY